MHDTGMHNLLHLPSFKDDRQYPTPSFCHTVIGKLVVGFVSSDFEYDTCFVQL